jgi:aldehyde:ferredoxin oxidoreductase
MVIDLLSKIAHREGFGDRLADGISRLAADWGVSDEPFNLSTGGQELPMHDPRSKVMVGLGYAVSTHGADHMNAPHDTLFTDVNSFQMKSVKPLGIDKSMTPMHLSAEGIDTYVKLDQVYKIMDTLGLCVFGFAPRGSIPLDTLVNCLQACTSWDVTLDEVVSAARRGNLMARAFNYRETAHPTQAVLPGRLFEPKPDGPHSGESVFTPDEFKHAVMRFYELSECDPETLRPNSDALTKYGLTWVDDLLKSHEQG